MKAKKICCPACGKTATAKDNPNPETRLDVFSTYEETDDAAYFDGPLSMYECPGCEIAFYVSHGNEEED